MSAEASPRRAVKRIDIERAAAAAGLDPLSRHVLATMARLAMRSDGTVGDCFPSMGTLAAEAGTSLRTTERRVALLREQGWLIDTGRRRGSRGRIRVYEIQSRQPGGINPATVADRITEHEQLRSDLVSAKVADPINQQPGETTMNPDEPTLFPTPAPPEGHQEEASTKATAQKPPKPFRSLAEQDAWDRCIALWTATASGTLRSYRRRPAKPTTGGGKRLLDVIRYLGVEDVQRSILWMTCAAEASYLRESEQPRGFDTLWNRRHDYPEKADDWLDADGRARVLAKRHGVPRDGLIVEGWAPADSDEQGDRIAAAQDLRSQVLEAVHTAFIDPSTRDAAMRARAARDVQVSSSVMAGELVTDAWAGWGYFQAVITYTADGAPGGY